MFNDDKRNYEAFTQKIKDEFSSLRSKLTFPRRKSIRFLQYVSAAPTERSYLIDFNSRYFRYFKLFGQETK